ncbi:unnamed protein product [Phytophthora lilii]|uniref:Unnamed protein product n=1 Tax=Phytophthora lilii TaxID=2077276 RepID=A0A9W6TJU0_9STRA|nr:unnamed protein product [Phytophthora lilii]
MDNERFTENPFGELTLSAHDRAKLLEIADSVVMAKFEEYEEHLNNEKQVDLGRWKKFTKSGQTTMYLERKKSSPHAKLPALLMVGPLPGSLDENMFGIVNPTIEAMRIKSSYLKDFSAAAVLATIVEPTVDEPFRSVVVKWMEIDIPGASIGIEGPDRTDCRGTGIMDPGGDMIRAMAVMGMVQATMAGLKYSYCGQMKKIAWLLEQKQASREKGTPAIKPFCVTCTKGVKSSRLSGPVNTCKLCFGAICGSCKITKKLSFIAPDLTLAQRKVTFCVKCMVDATQMDTQEAAREQFVYKKSVTPGLYGFPVASTASTCSESALTALTGYSG